MWGELDTHLNSPGCIPEKGILKAEHLGEYKLEIWFEENKDVSIYELDFFPILKEGDSGEAFRPLLDQERFSQVVGRYNLTWYDSDTGKYNENAIDISPEAIKWFCNKFGRLVKSRNQENLRSSRSSIDPQIMQISNDSKISKTSSTSMLCTQSIRSRHLDPLPLTAFGYRRVLQSLLSVEDPAGHV